MDRPSSDTIWEAIAGIAAAVIAFCLGALGIQYRRYRKDRHTLYQLRREMDEVNEIRKRTDDGRRAIVGLEQLSTRMDTLAAALETVVERQDRSEENQNEILQVLGRIDERQELMWQLMRGQ